MRMRLHTRFEKRRWIAAVALLLPGVVLAHGAHATGLAAGFMHPLSGADHLVAMLTVGIWSALTARSLGTSLWAPMAFAALLLVGALAGAAGLVLPAVEPMIAASLLVLGLLTATRRALPPMSGVALVGGFALFHGLAHGHELHGAAALAGLALATMLLHAAGLLIGHALLQRSVWWTRTAGTATGVLGAALLLAH